MPMRILIMADTPPNPFSGAAGTEFQTVMALRRLGHEVDVVWADGLSHYIRHGNLHYLLELPLAYQSVMRKMLSGGLYDVVHVNQPHGYLAARSLIKMNMRTVFVHRSHGFEPRVSKTLLPWQTLYERRRTLPKRVFSKVMEKLLEFNNLNIAQAADGHIVSASLCAEYLIREYKVASQRVSVIPQAPPSCFQETPTVEFDKDRLSKILYVGQFAFVKAPNILASAFERILEANPAATLTWVCDAKHHRDASLLLSAHAQSRTKFVDWLTQDELIEIYDQHGVFLFPSFFEGFGKAFLEAMSRGLVVIASNEGGAKDLISHSHNGFLVAVGDIEAIAGAYYHIHSNPLLAERISFNAREMAAAYTWDRVAVDTVSFYNRLLELKSNNK